MSGNRSPITPDGSPSSTRRFSPTNPRRRPHGAFALPASIFVDITAVELEKRRLLSHHVSQEEAMRLAMDSGIGDLSARLTAYRGEQAGYARAEAFVPIAARGAIKGYPVSP